MADEPNEMQATMNVAVFQAEKPLLAALLNLMTQCQIAGIEQPAIQVASVSDLLALTSALGDEIKIAHSLLTPDGLRIFGIDVLLPKLVVDVIPCPTCGGTDYALTDAQKRVLAS